jgi:proteasome lid subunit RPN8/RPN11
MEIEFGDIQQTPPETGRRPDDDRHLTVLPVFAPSDDDLPIYIDLDTLREIEEHAEADTTIELGGVLLGRHCQDESGRTFVVVNDCLRAEHYEATKGSFKFTHDTWQQFSRQIDEFPADVRMVGWYHTHPDWGVFLSGMDLFICENFFNKDLDLALVVDPCRHDCGFFQWTSDGARATRRTGGFYLFASRFRHYELTQFAEWLEDTMMPSDPRFRSGGTAPYPAPVVQLGESQAGWQSVTLLAIVAMQFCLLVMIAWRMTASNAGHPTDSDIRALQAQVDELQTAQQSGIEVDAKLQVLDAVLGHGPNAQQHLATSLAARSAELEEMQGFLRTQQTATLALEGQLTSLQSQFDDVSRDRLRLRKQNETLSTQALAATDAPAGEAVTTEADEQSEEDRQWWPLPWIAVIAAIGLLCAGGIAATFTRSGREPE